MEVTKLAGVKSVAIIESEREEGIQSVAEEGGGCMKCFGDACCSFRVLFHK